MTDRHLDFLNADIGALQPPSSRRMLDIRDKREAGLVLRIVSKSKGAAKRAWCWRYRDKDGIQRRLVFGHWPAISYDEAVRRLREARRGLNEGLDPTETKKLAQQALDGRISVSGLIDRYEAVKAPKLRAGAEAMRLLRKHVQPVIGSLAVADVTGNRLRRLLMAEQERLVRSDIELRKAGRKPHTFTLLTRIHAALGSLFTFAVNSADRIIESSPVPRLEKGGEILPAETKKGRAFTDAEVAAAWNGLDATSMDVRTRTALKLVLLTGMRPGEVLGLKRRDIDLSATIVDRRGGVERIRGNGYVTLKTTKNSLMRIVPLSQPARALLADALRLTGSVADAFVFPAKTLDGPVKPMEPQALARAMSRRKDVFGEEITPHRLRAMTAFVVERLGFGSAVARDVLGHIDSSVLRQHYSGFDGLPARLDALEAVAAEIERIIRREADAQKEQVEPAAIVSLGLSRA
jgi:integrase